MPGPRTRGFAASLRADLEAAIREPCHPDGAGVCPHQPQCMIDPHYCWPADYVRELTAGVIADGYDPVRVAAARGPGLAARVREHLER